VVAVLAVFRLLALVFLLACGALPTLAQSAEVVALTDAQRSWLAEHRQLRVGVVLQTPYAQVDRRRRQLSGLNIELMQWLASALQVELVWQQYADQGALEVALRAGKVDVAPGLSQTPAGLRLWLYSDAYMRVPQLLVGVRNGGISVDLERLSSLNPVAVRQPSVVADYLRGTYMNINLQAVGSDRQALQHLLSQQARYAVIDEAQFSRLSRESEFAELTVVGDIGLPQLLRVASRRDWPQLSGLLDAALQTLSAKQLDQLRGRWLQLKYPGIGDSLSFWRNLWAIFLVLLLAALAMLFSLRRQRDVLERRVLDAQQARELRESSEEALHLAQFSIDQSTVGILWVNWDSHVRYANRAAEQMLGYGQAGLLERPLITLEPSLGMDNWLALWKRARTDKDQALSFQANCLRADGSSLPADVSLSFLRFRQAEYLVVYITDVTERRRALAALQESEARLQGIAANVPGLVFRLERAQPEGPVDFAFISDGSEQLVGFSAASLMVPGRGIRSLVHAHDQPDYSLSQIGALEADRDWHWQGRILTRESEVRWADIRAIARRLEDGLVVWDGIVWDITENKRIELALSESRGQLRELSAHLESVREEEKARIAREVHDELGQVLTVLKLETAMCELAYGELDSGLQERLNSMKRLIASLFQLVRDVASALRPPILDAGISSAIEWQAQRFEKRTQIPCLVQVPDNLPPLADAKAIGLFRILQEALTNVMRHAQAHTVEVRLTLEAGMLCLTISDDGCGFVPPTGRPSSFGLVGMRERVLMLGGSLQLDSQLGEGTTLSASIPFEQDLT
jgi:PAS domain S-box-containing protein